MTQLFECCVAVIMSFERLEFDYCLGILRAPMFRQDQFVCRGTVMARELLFSKMNLPIKLEGELKGP